MDRLQLITAGAGEFGIESQHLDREVDFVDDALAGSVAAGEKLQVLDSIVVLNTVDVMNGFVGVKLAADLLLHDVAVFKHIPASGLSILSRDSEAHVPPATDGPGGFCRTVFFPVDLTHPLVLALLRTKFLFLVDRTASWATCFLKFFAAVLAVRFVPFVGIFSASERRTRNRTVERVATEFGSVGGEIRRLHGEWAAAFFAFEFDRIDARGNSSVDGFVRAHAIDRAEFSIGFPFAGNVKGSLAVFTNLLRDHVVAPLFGDKGTMAWISG